MSSLVDDIYRMSKEALNVVSKYAHKTPLDYSATFSRIAGGRVFLKCENLQKTGSFKVRGALYKISRVKDRVKGVVAVSAGNHAQGVAYASRCFGLDSIIVMPVNASIAKVEATKSYGAKVVLYGEVFDESFKKALEIARETGYEIIHAFNDPQVIAGQGTISFEVFEKIGAPDVIVVPIGGGGLISGIACVAKKLSGGRTRIIGVEPKACPKMLESMRAGRIVDVEPKPTIADGLVVKKPGELTFKLVSELVDDIVTVSEEEIAHAIYMLLERCKLLVEGAGAVATAAIISGKIDVKGRKTVSIVSGGNIDLTSLYKVVIRGLCEEGRIVVIEGYIPDTPGSLARVAKVVAENRGNIVEVVHRRAEVKSPAWHVRVEIIVEVPSRGKAEEIVSELNKLGYNLRLSS